MHEVIKEHSILSGKMVKENGQENDLFFRLAQDQRIPFSFEQLNALIGDFSQFTGRASAQTVEFLDEIVYPLLEKNRDMMGQIDSSLSV